MKIKLLLCCFALILAGSCRKIDDVAARKPLVVKEPEKDFSVEPDHLQSRLGRMIGRISG